jgi:Holliday junction resolvase
MSASERRKGNRVEVEIVNAHKEIGVHAERYPLSGASHFRGQGHDLDIYAFGRDETPAVAEVKARKEGTGFALLERWLGEYDLLFLRRDRQQPLVVLPWSTYERLIKRQRRSLTHGETDTEAKARGAEKPAQSPPA